MWLASHDVKRFSQISELKSSHVHLLCKVSKIVDFFFIMFLQRLPPIWPFFHQKLLKNPQFFMAIFIKILIVRALLFLVLPLTSVPSASCSKTVTGFMRAWIFVQKRLLTNLPLNPARLDHLLRSPGEGRQLNPEPCGFKIYGRHLRRIRECFYRN